MRNSFELFACIFVSLQQKKFVHVTDCTVTDSQLQVELNRTSATSTQPEFTVYDIFLWSRCMHGCLLTWYPSMGRAKPDATRNNSGHYVLFVLTFVP